MITDACMSGKGHFAHFRFVWAHLQSIMWPQGGSQTQKMKFQFYIKTEVYEGNQC